MEETIKAIESLREKTDSIILFHSASGKDSIVLLDLLCKYFKNVTPVYMYVVKDLEHINKYIKYAQKKYNVNFVQTPHFALYSYLKWGFLGCEKNPNQKTYTLSQITDFVREKFGIEWACFGFKKSDSLNRRLMLGTYEDGMTNETTKKIYPLSFWKNGDCKKYITDNNLISPEIYGKAQSSGTSVNDIDYLKFLEKNYPNDLKKVFDVFPYSKAILYEDKYKALQ